MNDSIEMRNIRTLAKNKDLWESNITANKPYIKHEISALWNDFGVIDGLLVSASPALKNNMPEIADKKRSNQKTDLVAVDMAAGYLTSYGLKPDYVISCDASADAARILDFSLDMPLICDVVTNPDIVRGWKGEKFFFVSNNPCIDLDNKKATFTARHRMLSGISSLLTLGGNVGSAGLSFLLSVRNCRKVYLYGHEFCWKKEGDFYCGGIQKELAAKRIEIEKRAGTLFERKDMNGDDVYTNMSLETFLGWYREVIQRYPGVIENRTGAGLLN